MNLPSIAIAILIAASCAAAVAQDDAIKDELKKLEGTYRMVRGEDGGKPLDLAVVKSSKLTITGNKHVVKVGTEVPMVGTHIINPFEKPASIDVSDTMGRFAGKMIKGIYKIDGDEFTVSFSPPDEPRPDVFDTKSRPGRMVHVWKRGI